MKTPSLPPFCPPPFHPHRLIRGGHLQTIASVRKHQDDLAADQKDIVELADGDAIVLHRNDPVDPPSTSASEPGSNRVLVLFHGLSGCHGSPYMIRLARRFVDQGWIVYRVDMRGCGDGWSLSAGISHAGRSDDVAAALGWVAIRHPQARYSAIGVSLGGNQLLRFAGRVGAGLDLRPEWFESIDSLTAVAPPIDLNRCSENMQRRSRRVYNHYFIKSLLARLSPRVRSRDEFQSMDAQGRPRTLLELDDRLTAPLSGFANAVQYYRECSSVSVLNSIQPPTLVIASRDDPIVPADCFTKAPLANNTALALVNSGGHAGFIGRDKTFWMDECIDQWLRHVADAC